MLILYVLFFLCWFFVNYRKAGLNGSSFLLLLFLTSSVCSVILMYYYGTYDVSRINGWAIIFHILCYYLFFAPLIRFGNKDISNVELPNPKIFNALLYLIIGLSICTYISSIPKVSNAFSYSDLSEARKLHNADELHEENSSGIIGYLGGIGQGLSFYALFFFFWIFSKKKKVDLLLVLLFMSSFGIVISNMGMMGRDGIVRWLLFFLFCFLYFKPYLGKKIVRKLVRYSVGPTIILVYVFFLISESRFGDRGLGVGYSFIDYLGQSNIYFSYGFDQFMDGVAGGAINFSYILGERVSLNGLNNLVYADYSLNTFSSFIGSFYFDMGLVPTFLIAFCSFVFFSIYGVSKKDDLTKIVAYLVLFEVVILGVFYYMFYGPTKVNTILMFIFLSWLVVFVSKNRGLKKRLL